MPRDFGDVRRHQGELLPNAILLAGAIVRVTLSLAEVRALILERWRLQETSYLRAQCSEHSISICR